MKAGERNSYMNRACRELMAAQHRVRTAETESGIVGLMKLRMAEMTYDCARAIYGQPSRWDVLVRPNADEIVYRELPIVQWETSVIGQG